MEFKNTIAGLVTTVAFALSAAGCMGFDVGPEGADDGPGLENQEQELGFRFDLDPADELAPPDPIGPDLVAEITCGWDHIYLTVRNQGNRATEAMACGYDCFPQFQSMMWIGPIGRMYWHMDLQPGEERTLSYRVPAGLEVHAHAEVDSWGNAVTETNENNNETEIFCVY